MHRGSVAAVRVVGVSLGEPQGEAVLVDGPAAPGEFPQEYERLGGVVSPLPQRLRGQDPCLQGRQALAAQDPEPAVAEGITEGETGQRVERGGRQFDHRPSMTRHRRPGTAISVRRPSC